MNEKYALRLLQGYIWHPQELELDLSEYLPATFDGDIHVIWDQMERAPFTFFDDGTPSATQAVYQFTVMTYITEAEEDQVPGRVPWLAEQLQEMLEKTPAGTGWSISEDLRPLSGR